MNAAILLSGGIGHRMGLSVPKQYIRVSGQMLITYCLETMLCHPMIDAVQIVAEEEWREAVLADVRERGLDTGKIRGFYVPGGERQSSVFHGLRDLKAWGAGRVSLKDSVLIHDAVRPNLSAEQITACFAALRGHEGVLPVLPMKDTVYLSSGGGRISKLLEREKVFAGQAPEVFRLGVYYAANVTLLPDRIKNINGSTEPAVMAGLDVAMIFGDENNFKITTKADLERFQSIVKEAQSL